MKPLKALVAASAVALLGGCVAVPYDSGYYAASPGYYAPAPVYVAPAPRYYGPSVSFGYSYGRGGYGHRRWR